MGHMIDSHEQPDLYNNTTQVCSVRSLLAFNASSLQHVCAYVYQYVCVSAWELSSFSEGKQTKRGRVLWMCCIHKAPFYLCRSSKTLYSLVPTLLGAGSSTSHCSVTQFLHIKFASDRLVCFRKLFHMFQFLINDKCEWVCSSANMLGEIITMLTSLLEDFSQLILNKTLTSVPLTGVLSSGAIPEIMTPSDVIPSFDGLIDCRKCCSLPGSTLIYWAVLFCWIFWVVCCCVHLFWKTTISDCP